LAARTAAPAGMAEPRGVTVARVATAMAAPRPTGTLPTGRAPGRRCRTSSRGGASRF